MYKNIHYIINFINIEKLYNKKILVIISVDSIYRNGIYQLIVMIYNNILQ